jgi:hypothetical protein
MLRLDLSFTSIRHRPFSPLYPVPPLEKLSLTSTNISSNELLDMISLLPRLKTLAIGALGIHKGSISNSSAMTMTDATLRRLTDILEPFEDLESVSLLGNTKLGSTSKADSALLYFVTCIGRKCRVGSIYTFRSLP